MADVGSRETVRLAEVMAAWSVAIDLALAAPLELGLRIAVRATRLAQRYGASDDELRRTYYLALLRHIGCTADNPQFADLVGDERQFRTGLGTVDASSSTALTQYVLRTVVGGRPPAQRPAALLHLLAGAAAMRRSDAAVCEVAQMLARRLPLGAELRAGLVGDLALVYERYDGKGRPNGLPGAAITLPAHVVHLAEAVTGHAALLGPDGAIAMLRQRRKRAFRPELVDCFLDSAADLLAEPDDPWEELVVLEPAGAPVLAGDPLDDALRSLADFVDLKSPYTRGHSRDVARVAADAARACGLGAAQVAAVRRAGWLHDVGRLSVSVRVWDRPGRLTRDEWEQVRLHPYYTGRVLSRPPPLAEAAALGGQHHERLDGSGYHRQQRGGDLPLAARLLAAADVYAALVAERPHRPALTAARAAEVLREEVRSGRLDGAAVQAVLQATGHRGGRRAVGVAGLTARETEVLRLLARGHSNPQIAAELVVSRKTVEHHVEAVYAKAGVTSRAGAALFAMQHGLLDEAGAQR